MAINNVITPELKVTTVCQLDITNNTYHHKELCPTHSVSSSAIKKILFKTPFDYWYHSNLNPDKPVHETTASMAFGQACHSYILDNNDFNAEYVILPESVTDFRTKLAKEQRDKALAAGKKVLLYKDYQILKEMGDVIKNHPIAKGAFVKGKAEQSLFWQDKETGVWCKCRPDFLPDNPVIVPDYKTSKDITPDAFKKDFFNYAYHMQAAWYSTGIKEVTGVEPEHFFFVVQAKEKPYQVAIYDLDKASIKLGDNLNRVALRKLANCLDKNKWPGYDEQALSITIEDLPIWLDRQYKAILEV